MSEEENQSRQIFNEEKLEPITQVPILTKETWELLEYRLWDKFRTRLWTIVGVSLTIVTIGGILGVNSYINNRIETQIQSEKKQLKKTQAELLRKEFENILFAKLINHLNYKLTSDKQVLYTLVLDIQKDVDSSSVKDKIHLKRILDRFLELNYDEYEYPEVLTQIKLIVENKNAYNITKSTLTEKDWKEISFTLNEGKLSRLITLITMYPHVKAFDNTIKKSMANQLKDYLINPDMKSKLYQAYETNFGKLYKDEIKRFPRESNITMLSIDIYHWYPLPLKGEHVFMDEENFIRGEDAFDY